jgi:hypothetical protein
MTSMRWPRQVNTDKVTANTGTSEDRGDGRGRFHRSVLLGLGHDGGDAGPTRWFSIFSDFVGW